jgi:replication factor C subunit 1
LVLTLASSYNASDHPIAFHKAADLGKAPKKLAGGPAPDLEEVFDVRSILARRCQADHKQMEEDIEEEKEEKPADPISKDKLLKESKPKGAGVATAKSKGKAREK